MNLLQPQDRRSSSAGDSSHVVRARARLIASGIGHALSEAVQALVATLDVPTGAVVVELGSGTGDALAAVAHTNHVDGIGIELSTAAADHAARLFPHVTWVVANADRRLPLADASVDLVLSLHGRRNPEECARVLTPAGWLLVALPAPDDLVELRAATLGEALPRPRAEALLAEHAPHFTVQRQATVREQRTLDSRTLRALLDATYRGGRRRVTERLDALTSLEVTLASEVFVLARAGSPPGERT